MLGISEAAGKLNLKTVSGRLTMEQLGKAPLPCILHWRQNHFVVLYRIRRSRSGTKTRYYVADPGKGLTHYTVEEFERGWISMDREGERRGVAMLLEPEPEFFRQAEERQAESHSLRFLCRYLFQYKRYFGQILLGLLAGCGVQLLLPFFTQAIVDIGIARKDIGFVGLVLLGQLMLTFSRTAVGFIRQWLLLHISIRINISLVSDFFIKLLQLPMPFFDTKLTGDLLQRMGDHSRVEQFLTGQTLNIAFSLLSFTVFGIVLLFYHTLIFLLFLAGSLLYGGWTVLFLQRRRVLDYELFEQQAINQNRTYQFITTMQEIKLQDCEKRRRWEWEDVQADLFEVQMKGLKLRQTQEAGSIFINETQNIVVTVVAALAVIHGEMTLGMMLAVQYIIGQLSSPVTQLMNFLYALQDVKISLERINEIHEMENEEERTGKLAVLPERPGLALEHVSFKYDPNSPSKVLDDICIRIPEGKTTAIVGASGSGKTTLLKLLLGFYPVTEGGIRIGDTPLERFSLKWWRRQCGVVMQDGVLFSESIARNIAVDDGEVNEERLMDAVKVARCHDFIQKLPLRFSTQIGRDGVGLSQGQKQRILIARAVYKDPRYLFLDEATNSLDAKNEREIVEGLDQFCKGRTVVVVAHRLSTVQHADCIIVLDKGRVAETGDHRSLIEKRGVYYELVKNQLELGNG